MMKTLTVCLSAAALAACGTASNEKIAAPAPVDPAWVGDARDISYSVPGELLSVLSAAIQKSGPADAIGICKDEAPRIARAASEKTGWQIRRVSLGNRNPKAVPDAWERETLERFDREQAAGVDPSRLERWEVVQREGQSVKRYMRALPTGPLCLQCHGSAEQQGPGVSARLAQLYPLDKATGYRIGQIRGAITLVQPLARP